MKFFENKKFFQKMIIAIFIVTIFTFMFSCNVQAKSEVAVFNDTFMSFYEGFIYLNDSDKNILILDKETLKQLEVLTEN